MKQISKQLAKGMVIIGACLIGTNSMAQQSGPANGCEFFDKPDYQGGSGSIWGGDIVFLYPEGTADQPETWTTTKLVKLRPFFSSTGTSNLLGSVKVGPSCQARSFTWRGIKSNAYLTSTYDKDHSSSLGVTAAGKEAGYESRAVACLCGDDVD